MRRSFALITLIVSVAAVAVACGDDADPARDVADTTTTTSTSSTTTTEPAGPPATFCEGVEQVNLLFDDIARTMLATMAGEPSAEFIVVLGRARSIFSIRRRRLRLTRPTTQSGSWPMPTPVSKRCSSRSTSS